MSGWGSNDTEDTTEIVILKVNELKFNQQPSPFAELYDGMEPVLFDPSKHEVKPDGSTNNHYDVSDG